MPSYEPPKRATEYITYVSLIDQASGQLFKANPTLAAGDVKVSIDGGALANLTTLPAVTPAASKLVKVTVSAAEMTGDNIAVLFSDAAGAEWNDLLLVLQPTVRQIDDLAFPTTSGRSLDVTATGAAGIDWANVENPTTALNLSATNIDVDQVVASVSGAVGSVTGNVGGNVAGSVGSVTGAVGSVTGNVGGNVTGSVGSVAANGISAASLAADAGAELADAFLDRNMATGTDSGSNSIRTVRQALRVLRNKWTVATGTYTSFKEDDTTTNFTAVVTGTAGADPLTESDPAGP